MERIPLLWQEKTVGDLSVETAGLYTCFSCSCRLPGEGLWYVWLVGDGGELRLGLLEPAEKGAVLKKRLSLRNWAGLGTLRCARLRQERSSQNSPPAMGYDHAAAGYRPADGGPGG